MARVAGCPQCSHELFVPDEADSEAWAKCPQCRAFFQVKQATSRDVPTLLLVDAAPDASDESEPQSAPTIADFASSATLSDANLEDIAPDEPVEPEAETLEFQLDDKPSPDDLAATAHRIDQWFRTAKEAVDTSESPERDATAAADAPVDDLQPSDMTTGATVYFNPGDLADAEASSDFELEEPSEPPQRAAWDDTTEMDGLLGDVDEPRVEEFAESEALGAADQPQQAEAEILKFSPEQVTPVRGARRRRRSPVRLLVMMLLGGVMGLAGGYYVLLWLRGPSIDILHVADYLPSAMLPPSFKSEPQQLAVTTPPAAPAGVESGQPPEPAEFAADESMDATDDTPEMPASYTTTEDPAATTEEPAATAPPEDNRYATDADESETPAVEPLVLDDDSPSFLSDEARSAESPAAPAGVARVADAPTFTAAELAAALEEAKKAQPSLVSGNLSDSREVAHAKGFGYSMLADLAQKSAFVEAFLPDETTEPLQRATDELFRQTLSDAHTRAEVAVILPKWLGSPNRKHGGVFFAANLKSPEKKGAVSECQAELEGEQSISLLVSPALAETLAESSRPMGVVGWVVDRPAEQIAGYTGDLPQAIWVSRLIRLE